MTGEAIPSDKSYVEPRIHMSLNAERLPGIIQEQKEVPNGVAALLVCTDSANHKVGYAERQIFQSKYKGTPVRGVMTDFVRDDQYCLEKPVKESEYNDFLDSRPDLIAALKSIQFAPYLQRLIVRLFDPPVAHEINMSGKSLLFGTDVMFAVRRPNGVYRMFNKFPQPDDSDDCGDHKEDIYTRMKNLLCSQGFYGDIHEAAFITGAGLIFPDSYHRKGTVAARVFPFNFRRFPEKFLEEHIRNNPEDYFYKTNGGCHWELPEFLNQVVSYGGVRAGSPKFREKQQDHIKTALGCFFGLPDLIDQTVKFNQSGCRGNLTGEIRELSRRHLGINFEGEIQQVFVR
jgi:hypothetical protein